VVGGPVLPNTFNDPPVFRYDLLTGAYLGTHPNTATGFQWVQPIIKYSRLRHVDVIVIWDPIINKSGYIRLDTGAFVDVTPTVGNVCAIYADELWFAYAHWTPGDFTGTLYVYGHTAMGTATIGNLYAWSFSTSGQATGLGSIIHGAYSYWWIASPSNQVHVFFQLNGGLRAATVTLPISSPATITDMDDNGRHLFVSAYQYLTSPTGEIIAKIDWKNFTQTSMTISSILGGTSAIPQDIMWDGKYLQVIDTGVARGVQMDPYGYPGITNDVREVGPWSVGAGYTRIAMNQSSNPVDGPSVIASSNNRIASLRGRKKLTIDALRVDSISYSGSATESITNVATSPYNVTAADFTLNVDTTSARTINLPTTPTVGRKIVVMDGTGNANAFNITVQGNGHNINGSSSLVINTNFQAKTFLYNGTIWNVIS
jgi:hypothetical protein